MTLAEPARCDVEHRVVRGETLAALASGYDVPIAADSGITDPNRSGPTSGW